MPLLVLYGILIAATPLLLFFFYLQFDRFRKRVTDLEEKNASQAAAFTREIAELKRQVSAQRSETAEHPTEAPKPAATPTSALGAVQRPVTPAPAVSAQPPKVELPSPQEQKTPIPPPMPIPPPPAPTPPTPP